MKVVAFYHRQDTAIQLPPGVELIADSAIVWPGHPLFLPDFDDAWVGKVMLAFRISRLGKGVAVKFAPRYFDAMTLAMLPQSVALTEELAKEGRPTGLCGCFDGAVAMGKWIPLPAADGPVTIDVDGTSDVVEQPLKWACEAIAALSHYATLKTGDILMPVALVPQVALRRKSTFTAGIDGEKLIELHLP